MSDYYPNARQSLWMWALTGMVILWGCGSRPPRTYEGPSLIGRYTLKIEAFRYSPVSTINARAKERILRFDSARRPSKASPLRDDPLDVVRASLIAQAQGTGLFKQVGTDLPSPDYVLSGNVELFTSVRSDSLGTHISCETELRAYLQDIEEGTWIWSGEGIGAELLHVPQVVQISPLDTPEMIALHAPWLVKWSPKAISEAAHEVMKQVVAVIVEREVKRMKEEPASEAE